jgi:hypothetical protein
MPNRNTPLPLDISAKTSQLSAASIIAAPALSGDPGPEHEAVVDAGWFGPH